MYGRTESIGPTPLHSAMSITVNSSANANMPQNASFLAMDLRGITSGEDPSHTFPAKFRSQAQ